MLNPIHLRTLVEVVQLGSFAGAANRLGYTASAVSQQMTALEQFVGVPLFERTARSAHPTEAARTMVRNAGPVFTGLDTVLDAARAAYDSKSDEVTLTMYASLARAVIGRVLSDANFMATGIRLRVNVQDPSSAVRGIGTGDSDITFVYRYSGSGLTWPSSVDQIDFGVDEYQIIAPTAWGIQGDEHFATAALTQVPWALHHPGSSDASIIDATFRQAGIRPRAMSHCDSFDVVLALVAAGAAAAFVPGTVAALSPEGVQTIEVPGMHLSRDVHALISPSAPGHATRSVLETIRHVLSNVSTGSERESPA